MVAKEPDPNLTNNRAIARVGLGADCTDKVRIRSGPSKRRFKPTATEPSRKRAILEVVNNSDVSVDVLAIEALDDEPFAVEGVLPEVPRTIRPGKEKRFLVGLIRGAGSGPALATRPYFRVTIECGGN